MTSFLIRLSCGVGVHWNTTRWYDVRHRSWVVTCKDCGEVISSEREPAWMADADKHELSDYIGNKRYKK